MKNCKNFKIFSQSKKLQVILLATILATPLLLINCNKKKIIEKKQIILISIDTLRGDHVSAYGYFRNTSPNLSQLIKDSVYYLNAYPNGCWTMPSHMSLLTGTLPSRHGINKDWKTIHNGRNNKMFLSVNNSLKLISQVLGSRKFNTIKYAKLPKALGFGKGFEIDKGMDPFYNDKNFNALLKELDSNKKKDFFLFIHTWMVHAPYTKTYFLEDVKINKKKQIYMNNFREFCKKKKAKNISRIYRNFLKRNKLLNVKDCITLYDSGIHYVDQYIGKLIEKCKRLNIYDNVMFIVVSDHGEHFKEHYQKEFYGFHGKDFYEEFIKIPLIIKYPHKFKQGIIKHPVSLIDVFPTILDYYKFEIPAFVQGNSILKAFSKSKIKYLVSEAVSLGNIERKMIRVGDLKYIITMENPSKPERVNWDSIIERRLYDLKTDPLEKNNLYQNLKFRRICINLEKMLLRIIKNSAKVSRSGKVTKIDKKTLEHMEALGYL